MYLVFHRGSSTKHHWHPPGLSNQLAREAILSGRIADLSGYGKLISEMRYGDQNSRIDLYLSGHENELPDCYVEVKNVSLLSQDGVGLFPDAVTVRGQKHLEELMLVRQQDIALCCCSVSSIQASRNSCRQIR